MNELQTQLLALVTFFAFPTGQYLFLKNYSRREGRPELWYLPAYGFRLVIRNIPGKKTLSDIKYRALVRQVVPSRSGASVATWNDQVLVDREDFFLFPGSDQVLLAFKLERVGDDIVLIHADKLGKELSRVLVAEKSLLIADYSANLENLLNFDVRLAKRIEITAEDLRYAADTVSQLDEEQLFTPSRVRNVG